MNRGFLLILFLLFFSSGCFAQQYKPEELALNKEEQDPSTWDFGEIKAGEILKHEFVLKNETAQALNIKEVTSSCGCTASEAKKTELLPGESTTIEVKFNSTNYSGPVQQYVYVHTDSLDNPVIRYIIKADVEK